MSSISLFYSAIIGVTWVTLGLYLLFDLFGCLGCWLFVVLIDLNL